MPNANPVTLFITRIPDFYKLTDKEQVVYIAYYLTELGVSPFSARDLENIFIRDLKRNAPRISPFLTEESQKRGGKGRFIKAKTRGYELNGNTHTILKKVLDKIPELKQFDDGLADLVAQVTDLDERRLLQEAIQCYKIGSNRAMVILTWIVGLAHLESHVFSQHLDNFNDALSRHPNRQVKSIRIRGIDDFSELKESSVIEVLRSAKVVSNSIKKMLETRLGERNTAAHPSSVAISSPQAIAFGYDIVANVILKY